MQIIGIMCHEHPNKIECHTIECNEAIQVRHKHIGFPIIFGSFSAILWIKYKILPNLVA
jgi:hypothetical protein